MYFHIVLFWVRAKRDTIHASGGAVHKSCLLVGWVTAGVVAMAIIDKLGLRLSKLGLSLKIIDILGLRLKIIEKLGLCLNIVAKLGLSLDQPMGLMSELISLFLLILSEWHVAPDYAGICLGSRKHNRG